MTNFLQGIAVGFTIGVGLMSAIFEFYRRKGVRK